MKQKERIALNLSAPNLLNICVDSSTGGEMEGRLYHYYKEEPVEFRSILELFRETEKLFDWIAFPQASTRSRKFTEKAEEAYNRARPEKQVEPEKLTSHRGEQATCLTCVCYRQHATWQGEMIWMETGEKREFRNEMEFLRFLESTLQRK